MTPRERVLAAIRREPLDRFPTDIWATGEVWRALERRLGVEDHVAIMDRLGIDGIPGIAAPYRGPEIRGGGEIAYDEWGAGYRRQSYGTGEYDEQVVCPLAGAETIDDLEAFRWPSPDWYDYDALPDLARRYEGRAVQCGYTAVFYFHNKLRGLEQSLMDPLERPEFTRHLLSRLSDLFHEYHLRSFRSAGRLIDLTQVTDDFGSQTGLLISPQVFDEFYRAPMQRAIDLAHSFGISVFHHDDGDVRPLLPRLATMGIDILNPIQWRCGDWDLSALRQEWGGRMCFHGGVDNQQTLPFGTPEEVRAEVCRLKTTLGRDGTGWICAPCHNIQSITPVDNIVAMYEEAVR